MKKLITLGFISACMLVVFGAWVQSDNGIAGYTSSPGESNCTNCHSGHALNTTGGSITVTSTMTNWQYVPGTTYTINIKVKRTGQTLFGVDAELLTVNDTTNAGTIVITNATKSQIKTKTVSGKSRNNFCHKSGGGLANDSATFSFNWTAPATNVGNVKLWVNGNAADNDGTESGDYIYTVNQIITPFVVTNYSVGGNVFNDANGLSDNIVNGTGTNAGGLFANLLSSANLVVATSTVSAGGVYGFTAINAGNYTIQISTVQGTVGQTAPALTLPATYVNTGEFIGTGVGNDGTVNGLLSVTVTNANIVNANFGIDRLPVSNNLTVASQSNPGTTVKVVVPALSGTDAEDGTLGTGKSIKILTLPTTGKLYYNNVLATVNQVISAYNPTLLAVDPNNGALTISFNYTFIDAAGKTSATAGIVSMPFVAVTLTITPTTLTAFTGTIAVPSAAQSFTLSGKNLLDSVKVTAPAKFQVSLSATTGWKTSFKLPKNGTNQLPATIIYVRYKPTAIGTDTGRVALASLGATTKKIFVSGTAASRLSNNESSATAEISLAPNPVVNQLNICNLNSTEKTFVTVYNIAGSEIQSYIFEPSDAMTIDVSTYTNGLYMCRIESGNMVTTRKFVKQ